jgi:hypothetical protein
MLSMHPSLKVVNIEKGLSEHKYYYEIKRLPTLNDVSLLLKMIANITFFDKYIQFCVRDKNGDNPNYKINLVKINFDIMRMLFVKEDIATSPIDSEELKSSIETLMRIYKFLCVKKISIDDIEEELLRFHFLKVIALSRVVFSESSKIERVYHIFKKTDKPVYKEFSTTRFNFLTSTGFVCPLESALKKYVFVKESVMFKIRNTSAIILYNVIRVEDKAGRKYYIFNQGETLIKHDNIFPDKLKVDMSFIRRVENYGAIGKDYKRKELITKIFKCK